MSTLRTFNLQHPESSNNNIQLAEGGGVSVTAGILTATNVSSTNVTTTNVTTTEVTATNGTFSGNLSVGGVLSYEDVTNVDSIGIGTFRDGLYVTGGSVGIGTDNPADKLSIYAAPNSLVLGAKDTTRGNHIFQLLADNPAGDGELRLYKNSGSGTHEKTVEIASTGNSYFNGGSVAIGTNNPGSNKLQVQGSSAFYGNGGVSATWGDTSYLGALSFDGSAQPVIRASSSKALIFQVNQSTEALRITSDGKIGVGVASPQQELDVVGSAHTVAVFRPDTNTVSAYGDASVVNNLVNLRMPYGSNPGSQTNNGARWGIKFQGRNDGNEYGTDAGKSASIYAVSEETNSGYNRQVGLSFYTSPFDANQTERLRITSGGDVNILGGILNLGTADLSSGHINSYELMSFNIDTDNDDGNRYFIFKKDAATAGGTELMRLTEGGNLGIGGQDPGTGDGGNSNYNNWDIPKLHVRGSSGSGKFHLLGRFHAGNDSDNTGAQIVIHHENDRGMALQGGRSSGNRSYGAIKSLDNLARESNVMVFTGGTGQGVENIKFYTNGGSTGTNERMSINTHGTVHTGGSTEISQSSLTPDLITQAGVVSPIFYRPFQSMSGAPSTSGPGYVDFGTGGVRHNLTDPHLGASYGGSQFQGGLIGGYSQTFSNTASGTTREEMNWNRIRLLFRGLCLSTGHSPPTVKFRYSTYHYSNGWTDHSGTEWSFSGTEQARGGRWVVGPWINPTSYFTSWADVPGFGLYYNDNSSGKTFRIAGGVYFQFAHFI